MDDGDSSNAQMKEFELSPYYKELWKNARTSESAMRDLILALMTNGQTWTNASLKNRIKRMTDLSPADNQRANFDPNSQKWEGIVNNALSGSLLRQGFIERLSRGEYRITDSGRGHYKEEEAKGAFYDSLDF